jgi:hypothetical protein
MYRRCFMEKVSGVIVGSAWKDDKGNSVEGKWELSK